MLATDSDLSPTKAEMAFDLRHRALRIRRLASALIDAEAERQLLAMAEELEARAAAFEAAAT